MNTDTKNKGKPLSEDKIKSLLVLIENSKIITTNATNNSMKVEECKQIAEQFNATATRSRECCRSSKKWGNLKKNSHKHSTKIRRYHLQTESGLVEYIPPDEILNRVTSELEGSVNRFTVPFGGDKEPVFVIVGDEFVAGEGDKVDCLDLVLSTTSVASISLDKDIIVSNDTVPTPENVNRFTFSYLHTP
ncbi:uncharacterized protein ACR2FA_005186 [Aphomia sociella]